jgi:RND family efflux transporter MFP subunit
VKLAAAVSSVPARAVAASIVSARLATISTRVAATVRAVHAKEGDRVQAGQLLATLADDDIRAQLASAKAGLAAAQSQERRLTSLIAQRAATAAELEQAQTQRSQADAAVHGIEAQLAYSQLRAPFAGVIQAKKVTAGDLVGPGAPLFELDGGGLEVAASLSEEEVRGLQVGARLPFESEAGSGEAEVIALVPGGDPVSHRSGLRAKVRSGPKALRTGAFVRLILPARAEAAALWVPRAALVQRGDLTGVFVAEEGIAALRWLSLAEEEAGRVRVRAGLRDGDRFIADPKGLRDGQAIRVVGALP